MTRKAIKITVVALAAAIGLSSTSITAEASNRNRSSVLASGGIGLTMQGSVGLEEIAVSSKPIEKVIDKVEIDDEALALSEATGVDSEEELFKSLVIAQVSKYVNVRDLPGEDGKIVGKLYNNSVGTYISEENGWYLIQSGTVIGYVKGEYCVTGEDAVALAKEVGTRFATVTTTTLKVRSEASIESSVLGLVPLEEDLLVVGETDEWVQVDYEEGTGWVSKEYVELTTEFVKAESKEEESKRLAKEAEERRKAQAAAAASQKSSNSSKKSSGNSTPITYAVSDDASEMAKELCEYALQFVGNPYKWGGTSLTNGADCSGFVMSVYANYGISLPHSSKSDRTQGSAVDGLENALPGDLICYSGHVALYIGDGQIVHAANKKAGIIVSRADYKKILAIRRIL